MTSPLLLCFALALTTASQLRIGATPVGPGEVLLLLWLVHALLGLASNRARIELVTPQFRPIAGFWACNWALMITGAIVAYRHDLLTTARAAHDALAFVFVTAFCLLLAVQPQLAKPERLARTALICIGGLAVVLLLASQFTGRIGPVSLWFGERLTGWSRNPNQLVQLILPLPFLAAFLFSRARSPGESMLMLFFLPALIVFGVLTRSDAALLGWAAGLAAAFVVATVNMTRAHGRSIAETMAWRVVAPVLMLVTGGGIAWWLFGETTRMIAAITAAGGQGAVRLVLWLNGAQAITESPVVGFGPGGHSGFFGPFQGKEAHNTLLDWGTSTGVTGLVLLVLLLLIFFRHVWQSRSPALVGAYVSLLVFIQFDYALRQPIFWFWLLLVPGLAWPLAQRRRPEPAGSLAATRA